MSYGQIAEQIGRPEKSVDNAIQRLKKKLKKVEKSVDTRETL
jgi:sigma-70, region 4